MSGRLWWVAGTLPEMFIRIDKSYGNDTCVFRV